MPSEKTGIQLSESSWKCNVHLPGFKARETVREIQSLLAEQYGTEVSPDLISSITVAVMSEVTAWPARALEPMYPVVFRDGLRVKIREEGGC